MPLLKTAHHALPQYRKGWRRRVIGDRETSCSARRPSLSASSAPPLLSASPLYTAARPRHCCPRRLCTR
eukprot:885550-Rhodomonas_salina.1